MTTLDIALRVYPGISKTPAFYPDDKIKLFELSLRSMITAIGRIDARLTVLLDGCPDIYEELVRSVTPEIPTEIVRLDGAGNHATYAMQIERLKDSDAEFVYLAEDDYLYLPGSIETAVEFLRDRPDIGFVSLYDHPDYYDLSFHDVAVPVSFSHGRHWREAATTCLSFLTRPLTLAKNQRVLTSFSRNLHDAAMWLAVTKTHVFDPLRVFRMYFDQKKYARWTVQTWQKNVRHILFSPKAPLFVPLPSLATHLESTLLAPGIEWDAVARGVGWSPD